MKKLYVLFALVLLSLSAYSQVEFKKTDRVASFIDGDNLVLTQPAGQDTVRWSPPLESLSYEERAKNLQAVMVDPEGNVYEGGMSAEDLEIFDRGVKMLKAGGISLTSPGRAYQWTADDMAIAEALQHEAGILDFADDMDRIVHGSDGRKQITKVQTPYLYMGRISVGCTGTLIGPKHVLTAGHCVSDGEGNWYSSLSFSANQLTSFLKPFGQVGWKRAITVGKWHNDGNANYDYAMIILKKAPHGAYSSFGVYSDGNYTVTGYPGDKPTGTLWEMSGDTWSNDYKVFYNIDTAGGQSGSGVRDGNDVVRGIHAHGYANKNGGVKIRSSMFNSFTSWIANNP